MAKGSARRPYRQQPDSLSIGAVGGLSLSASPPYGGIPAEDGMGLVYLARHGRTALNAAGVLRGRLDPELDFFGVFQARMLGIVLGNRDLRVVVSSPLRRAVDTASAVAERAGLQVAVDDRLIDRDYGPWAGKPKEAVLDRWGSLDDAPDIEPASAVLARATAALVDARDRAGGGGALVVSHDAVNRLLIHEFDPAQRDVEAIPQETGCFNVLDEREGRWLILSINNVSGGRAIESTPDAGSADHSAQGLEGSSHG